MSPSHINSAAIEYWRRTKYTSKDVDDVCREVDHKEMAARVHFDGLDNVQMTLTERTWERQEGHYPSAADFFGEVALHPTMKGKKGTLIVWLEDGLWEWNRELSGRAPIFAFGRHVADHRTVLIPDPAFFSSRGYEDDLAEMRISNRFGRWNERHPTVFWRGASTGIGIEGPDWINTARGRLTLLARKIDNPEILDAKFSKLANLTPEQQIIFKEHNLLAEHTPFKDFLKYRYLVDADGYCCAWRSLFLKLASGSVTLKIHSDYEQWYFRELIPWKHFVPLHSDLRDFDEIFRWLRAHDESASEMVQASQELVSKLDCERYVAEGARLCSQILDCCVSNE